MSKGKSRRGLVGSGLLDEKPGSQARHQNERRKLFFLSAISSQHISGKNSESQ